MKKQEYCFNFIIEFSLTTLFFSYEKAESDCTMSLKLDNTYVKALQRRAAAREALDKLDNAKADLLRVLELEPRNIESRTNLENLEKKLMKTQKVVNLLN